MFKKSFLILAAGFIIIFFLSFNSIARKEVDKVKESLEDIKKSYDWGNYETAAKKSYLLEKENPTAEGAYYLAKSLFHLGLSHGTVEYLYEAAIKGGEVLDKTIQAIHYIVEERPFDWDLVMHDLIGDNMFGVLSDENSDFLYYYKGYLAYKENVPKWKENSFKKIRPDTTYYYKSQFVDIVDMVRRWHITKALATIENLVKADIKDKKFKNQVFQTYGRLLYQKKRYYEAFDVLRVVDLPILESESLFLEKAWTLFYLQDFQGALGNLLSLDAPIYSGYNKPERFVLQGLIFQSLCHFDLAIETIKAFRETYKDVLRMIKERKNLDEEKYMYEAFRRHPLVKDEVDFLDLLRWERNKLDDYSGSLKKSGLFNHLVKIYDYKLDEMFEKIDRKKEEIYESISSVLLDAEEQISFLEYEVNMDKLKRRKLFDVGEESDLIEKEVGKENIKIEDIFRWPFEGEFWTDELGEYRVLVKDACSGLTN